MNPSKTKAAPRFPWTLILLAATCLGALLTLHHLGYLPVATPSPAEAVPIEVLSMEASFPIADNSVTSLFQSYLLYLQVVMAIAFGVIVFLQWQGSQPPVTPQHH